MFIRLFVYSFTPVHSFTSLMPFTHSPRLRMTLSFLLYSIHPSFVNGSFCSRSHSHTSTVFSFFFPLHYLFSFLVLSLSLAPCLSWWSRPLTHSLALSH